MELRAWGHQSGWNLQDRVPKKKKLHKGRTPEICRKSRHDYSTDNCLICEETLWDYRKKYLKGLEVAVSHWGAMPGCPDGEDQGALW